MLGYQEPKEISLREHLNILKAFTGKSFSILVSETGHKKEDGKLELSDMLVKHVVSYCVNNKMPNLYVKRVDNVTYEYDKLMVKARVEAYLTENILICGDKGKKETTLFLDDNIYITSEQLDRCNPKSTRSCCWDYPNFPVEIHMEN